MARLEQDPAFLERRRLHDEAVARRAAENRAAARPLLDALQELGVVIDFVFGRIEIPEAYPKVLPVLLEHLQRPYPEQVREGIARALAVPEAFDKWGEIVDRFKQEPGENANIKFALGLALVTLASSDRFEEILSLLRDKRHGVGRIALLELVAKSRDPRRGQWLDEFSQDPDLTTQVDVILKRIETYRRRAAKLHNDSAG